MKTKNRLFNIVIPFLVSASISFYASKISISDFNNNPVKAKSAVNSLSVSNNQSNRLSDKLSYELSDNTPYNMIDHGLDMTNNTNLVNDSQLEKIISNYDTVDLINMINHHAYMDKGKFGDNRHYKIIRRQNAQKELSRYDIDSKNVLVIDKTFQKAMIFTRVSEEFEDSSNTRQNSERYCYVLADEFDCSTAKIYGKKQRNGDGKTPEGLFFVSSIESSHNKVFDGEKAYGSYFMRIYNSIGIHGNGTDTVKVKKWQDDPAFMMPDLLGITDENNFGYGVSHGCGRLDNKKIRENVEDGTFYEGMPVLIYDDEFLTRTLTSIYTYHYREQHINNEFYAENVEYNIHSVK